MKVVSGVYDPWYHIPSDDNQPVCGTIIDLKKEVMSIGDTDRKDSLPLSKSMCPDCIRMNEKQVNLF